MELKEYKLLCEEAKTGCNPNQLNEKPDELVRLKTKLVKEFKDFPIKCKYPSFMSFGIMFEDDEFIDVILDYDPDGRIVVISSLPDTRGMIYLENDDKLIPRIKEIIEELARKRPC